MCTFNNLEPWDKWGWQVGSGESQYTSFIRMQNDKSKKKHMLYLYFRSPAFNMLYIFILKMTRV